MKYLPISNDLFTKNRKNFVLRTKTNSIAIFHSNDEFPKNGDQTFIFKQNADFFHTEICYDVGENCKERGKWGMLKK